MFEYIKRKKKELEARYKTALIPWVKNTLSKGMNEREVINANNSNDVIHINLDSIPVSDANRKEMFSDPDSGVVYIETLKELEEKYLLSEYSRLEVNDFVTFRELRKNKAIIARNKITNKVALGLKYPILNILNIPYDEIFIIGNEVTNFFHTIDTLKFNDDVEGDDVNAIMQFMENKGYSDLHFFAKNDLYYDNTARENSNIVDVSEKPIPRSVARNIIRQLTIACNQDPYTKKKEIRGLIQQNVKKGAETIERNYRIHMVDSSTGNRQEPSVSIRRLISWQELKALGMIGLGYSEKAIEIIMDGIRLNHSGIIIISGETNSGKTTLLYTMLLEQLDKGKRVHTIEKPIEIRLEGAIQINLTATEDADEKRRMTFEDAMKSLLSQDPDNVAISEVRSASEIDAVANLALQGHLAFTTMHSNDNSSTIKRYIKSISGDPEEVNSSVRMIINQELINKKCQNCNGTTKEIKTGEFCQECSQGSVGRLPVYEISLFQNIDPEDNLSDFATLIRDKKMRYISKRKVIEDYKRRNLILDSDYERIIYNTKEYSKELIENIEVTKGAIA